MEQGDGPRSPELAQADRPLPACVFDRGQSTQAAVRTELIVILAPGFDQLPGFGEPEEKMFIGSIRRTLHSNSSLLTLLARLNLRLGLRGLGFENPQVGRFQDRQ